MAELAFAENDASVAEEPDGFTLATAAMGHRARIPQPHRYQVVRAKGAVGLLFHVSTSGAPVLNQARDDIDPNPVALAASLKRPALRGAISSRLPRRQAYEADSDRGANILRLVRLDEWLVMRAEWSRLLVAHFTSSGWLPLVAASIRSSSSGVLATTRPSGSSTSTTSTSFPSGSRKREVSKGRKSDTAHLPCYFISDHLARSECRGQSLLARRQAVGALLPLPPPLPSRLLELLDTALEIAH